MSFGNFTLTGTVQRLDGKPALGARVFIDGIPTTVVNTAGDTVRAGLDPVRVDLTGKFSVSLPSDATTGNSTTIGFRVATQYRNGAPGVGPVTFYARPIGATVDLADITPQVVESLGDTAANVIAAQAAADRAQGYAAVIDPNRYPAVITPEQYGAVGDLTADDTTPLRNAMTAAAASGALLWMSKRYRVTNSLLVDSGLNMHLAPGSRIGKDFAGAALITNRNMAGKVKTNNVNITGPGEMGATDYTMTGDIITLYGDDCTFADFTIRTWNGRAFIVAGDRMRIMRVRAYDTLAEAGCGGIRMVGGDRFVAMGCHVESGDDTFQFVPIAKATDPLYNMDITNSAYIGCTGWSSEARFLIAALEDPNNVGTMTASIRDVGFYECNGRGTQRLAVAMNNEGTTLDGCTFADCVLTMNPSTTYPPQAEDILVQENGAGTMYNVRLIRVKVINPVGTARTLYIQNAIDTVVDGCDLPAPAGTPQQIITVSGSRTKIRNSIFRGAGSADAVHVIAAGSDTDVSDNTFLDLPAGAVYGVQGIGAPRLNVSRNRFYPVAGSTTSRAFRFDATSTGARALYNDLSPLGNATFPLQNLATDAVLRGNVGWNPRGNVTAPAIPATGVAQTNQTGFDCTVYVTGGTVTSVSVGGTTTGLTSGPVRVPANQTITLAYSVAPTWKWFAD